VKKFGKAWVDVTGAGAHHESLQSGHAHGRVDPFTVQYCCCTAAIAKVRAQYLAIGRVEAEALDGLPGYIAMTGTVKSITSDAQVGVQMPWNRVQIGSRWQSLVKGSIEHCDLRNVGPQVLHDFDTEQILWIMQGRQDIACF